MGLLETGNLKGGSLKSQMIYTYLLLALSFSFLPEMAIAIVGAPAAILGSRRHYKIENYVLRIEGACISITL